jgi:hypothetical protein
MSYPITFDTPGVRELARAIDDERQRQLAKWGDQRRPSGTGPYQPLCGLTHAYLARTIKDQVDAALAGTEPTGPTWSQVLLEEVFEALETCDPRRLRAELIQAAAVIAAWIHDLDRPTNAEN